MTKADQIRKLDNGKRTTRQIADAVGCDTGYVRVVLRQRINGGFSDIDVRYATKWYGSVNGYHRYLNARPSAKAARAAWKRNKRKTDPAWYAKELLRTKLWKQRKRQEQREARA